MSIWIESVRVFSVLLRHSDTDYAHRSTIRGDALGATGRGVERRACDLHMF